MPLAYLLITVRTATVLLHGLSWAVRLTSLIMFFFCFVFATNTYK